MTGKALVAAAAAAVALLAAGSAHPRAAKNLPLLGIMTGSAGQQSLVRVNPANLRPLPGRRLDVRYISGGWAYAPNSRLLALARHEQENGYRDSQAFIRLIDPMAMATVADIPIGRGPLYGDALQWLQPDRIVGIAWDCCADEYDLVVVDPEGRRVVERRALHVYPIRALRAGKQLVVLAAPRAGIGPVSVLTIDPQGSVRSVVLDRIEGGSERLGEEPEMGVKTVRPALVVLRGGERALVFSPSGLAAEVDLGSFAVEYHRYLAGRAPAARTKRWVAAQRWAEQVGDGLVAVTGSSHEPYVDAQGKEQFRSVPAGVVLVDVRGWTVRAIDANADVFALASDNALTEDLLLVTGLRADTGTKEYRGSGLTAYSLSGRLVFQLFKGKDAYLARVYRTRAYVGVDSTTLRVVDIGSHRVTGKRAGKTLPWLITP
jgi:hypothetical protein